MEPEPREKWQKGCGHNPLGSGWKPPVLATGQISAKTELESGLISLKSSRHRVCWPFPWFLSLGVF